jgi:alanyl-tRNA synthetase
MGIHKTEKPIFPKEFIWPAKMIHIATDTLGPLAALPQNAAQATSDPAIKRRKRPLMAVLEILKPSPKCAIYVRRNSCQTVAAAATGLGTNGVFELSQALLTGPTCASLEVIPEEVKSLTRKGGIYNAGLLWMQDQSMDINSVRVLAAVVEAADPKAMRDLGDKLRDQLRSGIILLGSQSDGKATLLCLVTSDLAGRYQAGRIIKELAPLVGGNSGGRPDLAQAGGPNPGNLAQAVARIREII